MSTVLCCEEPGERTAASAFRELVGGRYEETRGIPWKITKVSESKTHLSNGLQYCFVEVTFANGIQYGLEAFDHEAKALYSEVSAYV